jgi:hypothetical protein
LLRSGLFLLGRAPLRVRDAKLRENDEAEIGHCGKGE